MRADTTLLYCFHSFNKSAWGGWVLYYHDVCAFACNMQYAMTCNHTLCFNVQARVVNLPGMDDVPSSSFEDFNMLMEKLGLGPCDDEQDGEEHGGTQQEGQQKVGGDKKVTWRQDDGDKLRQELKMRDDSDKQPLPGAGNSWREERSRVTPETGEPKKLTILVWFIVFIIDTTKPSMSSTELSYEERAALRRAEREKRRQEREKLASGK